MLTLMDIRIRKERVSAEAIPNCSSTVRTSMDRVEQRRVRGTGRGDSYFNASRLV